MSLHHSPNDLPPYSVARTAEPMPTAEHAPDPSLVVMIRSSHPEDLTSAQADAESAALGEAKWSMRNVAREREPLKMLQSNEQSRNGYENKQKHDNLPGTRGDISTQLRGV
jgi:hypothetical protein